MKSPKFQSKLILLLGRHTKKFLMASSVELMKFSYGSSDANTLYGLVIAFINGYIHNLNYFSILFSFFLFSPKWTYIAKMEHL